MRTNVSPVATVIWRAVLSIILMDISCRSFPSSKRSSRQVASWEALLLLAGAEPTSIYLDKEFRDLAVSDVGHNVKVL